MRTEALTHTYSHTNINVKVITHKHTFANVIECDGLRGPGSVRLY